jgi:hypothetical protein
MEEIIEPFGEGFGACFCLDRVAHGHVLKREREIGTRLNGDRVTRDADEIAARKTSFRISGAETVL